MRLDGRLQIFSECGHYLVWDRACPSDSQEAILARARSISKLRVAKANLGSSTRVVPLPESKCHITGPARNRFRTASLNAYNATVPEAVDMDLQFIAYQPEDDDVPEVIIGSNPEL